MIGNPYPQFQNVQEWNDFVNEVRHVLARTERTLEDVKRRVLAGEGEYDFPEGTAEEAGVVKLYPSTGDNEDGTVTQKGIKQAIDNARYTLPSATASRLGGVKVGDRLTIDEDGVLSASAQSYTLPIASDSILGGVKIGQGLEIEEDGTLNAAGEYSLPIASDSVLGGIKVGSGLTISNDGELSTDGSSGSFYGVCNTAGATAAKEVSISGFRLETGASVKVKFTNDNSADSPTLNVSSTGAKSIKGYQNYDIQKFTIRGNTVYEFVYDGTYWLLLTGFGAGASYATTAGSATTAYNIPTWSGLGNIWIE